MSRYTAAVRRVRFSAAVAALVLLAAACPSDTPRPDSSPGATTQSPSAPPAGEIRLAWPHEPATLNPFLRGGEAPSARALVRPLFPPLFLTGPGGRTRPWLVEKVLSEEPRAVRFSLRRDAVWSDGTPIGAADVVYTWRTVTDPRVPVVARAGYDAIASVEAEQPDIVRMTFTRDVPAWRDLFSAGLGVLPSHALEGKDFATMLRSEWPVSGGPYVLARYTRGLEMVLEATPKPWRVRARVKTIRVMFVPDSTTAIQMLRAGRVDALGPYSSPDFARRLSREEGVTVTTDTDAIWTGLVFNSTAAVVSDARVRRAAALSIDRTAIAERIVRDEGEPLTQPFALPRISREGIPFDPAQAAALLDQAGYRGSGDRSRGRTRLSISIATVGSDDLVQRAVRAVFAGLDSAGFAVDLVSLEDEALWRDWLPSGRFRAAVVTFADPPGGALRGLYRSDGAVPRGVNAARVSDPALDAAIDAGDPARVAAELDRLVAVVPLWRATVPAASRAGIGGVKAVASADGMLGLAHEWTA